MRSIQINTANGKIRALQSQQGRIGEAEVVPEVDPVLKVTNINKSFNGVQVLRNMCLEIRSGTVHALLGVNGSGKSTLIKILSGYHRADSGTITVNGISFTFSKERGNRYDPKLLPLAFVHQELGLLPDLSVTENFYLREISASRGSRLIRWNRKRNKVMSVLEKYGVRIDVNEPVRRLQPVDRARVAILRAYFDVKRFSGSRTLLVLDEPTVFLPPEDREQVWELLRGLTRDGGAVLLVTHELVDVRSAAHEVTILREGEAAMRMAVEDCDEETVVAALLGKHHLRSNAPVETLVRDGIEPPAEVSPDHRRRVSALRDQEASIKVEHLHGGRINDASFSLCPGEIVGLTGIAGSGYEDIPYVLYGAIPGTGVVSIGGQRYSVRKLTPRRARLLGMALVPADRSGQAAFLAMGAAENICAPNISSYCKRGLVSSKKMKDEFMTYAKQFGISPKEPGKLFSFFSGGNQQKIVLAKWLLTDPYVMLLHEPTQGVDIASRNDLIDAIRQAAQVGLTAVWCSNEQDDLARACDRVLVFREGAIIAELKQPLRSDEIVEACYV